MDEGVEAVYRAIPIERRGPGVHIMTGPIHVEGAEVGDTLEIRVLSMEPRLPYGTNIAAWWGHLYDSFGKERITIYRIDAPSGLARAAFAFDYTTTPRYEQPGIVVRPDASARQAALANVVVPLRPHFGVGGVAPREAGRINSIPPGEFGGNIDNWRFGPGRRDVLPGAAAGRPLLPRRSAHGGGRRRAVGHGDRGVRERHRPADPAQGAELHSPMLETPHALDHARVRRGSQPGDEAGGARAPRLPRRAQGL